MSDLRSRPVAVACVVALALFTDMLVYGIVIPILPTMLQGLELQASDLGLLVGAYALGLLAFTPAVGWLCDKYSHRPQVRRACMLLGLAGLGASTLLFGVIDTSPSNKRWGFWQLAAARCLQGVSGGTSWTIGLALLAEVYPRELLGQVMGVVMSAQIVGQLLGPVVGAVLYQYVSRQAPFILAATLALLDLLGRLYVRPVKLQQSVPLLVTATAPEYDEDEDVPINTQPVVPLRHQQSILQLIMSPQLAICFAVTVALATAFSALEPTLPLHLPRAFPTTDNQEMSQSMIGLLFTCLVVPNVVMAVWAGWLSDRYSRLLVSGVGMLLSAVTMPLVALPHSQSLNKWGTGIWWQVLTLMAFGASAAVAITPILPQIADSVTQRGGTNHNLVYAAFNVFYSVGMLIGPVLAGYLYESFGFWWCMFTFAAVLLVIGVGELAMQLQKRQRYVALH